MAFLSYIAPQINTHVHVYAQHTVSIHRKMQTQMYVRTYTHRHIHTHANKCTHTHTHTHTHMHTHTHTYTLSLPCMQWFPPSKDSQQGDVGGCSDSNHTFTSSTSSRNNDGFDLMEVEPRATATSVGRSSGDTTNTVKGMPYIVLKVYRILY